MKKEQNRLAWFKQPFAIFIFWILIFLIIGKTYFLDIAFLLTPFVFIGIGIYSIIVGIRYFRKYDNKLLGFFNLVFGILIILGIVFLVYVLLSTIFTGSVDLKFGEYCGHTASGYGTCGYMGAVKDCDCTGEKYQVSPGFTDSGYIIKCDGKASNFRDVPLPDNICEGDPAERCRLLGGSACENI